MSISPEMEPYLSEEFVGKHPFTQIQKEYIEREVINDLTWSFSAVTKLVCKGARQ